MRNAAKTALLGVAVLVCAVVALKGSVLQVASGTWAPTANLAQPSAGASAALLQDGRILITGGDAGNGPTATADFVGADGSLSAAPPMLVSRTNHIAVALQDGRVLVAGGTTTGGGVTNSAEIYDAIANTWASIPGGMMEARAGAATVLLTDGRVFIAGGQGSASTVSSTTEIFDPAANEFSFAGPLVSPRKNHAAAVLVDGRVLIVSGTDANNNILATSDIFDPVAGTVSAGPKLSTPRQNASATTLLDGRVLIAGGTGTITNPDGSTTSVDLGSAEILDSAATAFTLSPSPMITARRGHQAFLLPHNGSVMVVGGSANGIATASAELFVPWIGSAQAGAFQSTTALGTARAGAIGSAFSNGQPTSQNDGLLFVAGGTDASSPAKTLASSELYGFAWVKTDQSDYAPGTTVTITGSGWQPGETVTLSFLESPLIDTHPTLTAVADANGNITNTQFSPDSHDVNIRFYLTATGSASRAQTTFTDGKVMTVTVAAPTSATVAPGGTAVYGLITAGFNGTFNANSPSCAANLGTATLPTGASPLFGTNPLVSQGADVTSTFSVSTTNSTPTGTTTFTVTATDAAGCQDTKTTQSNSVTLIVVAPKIGSVSVGSQAAALTYGTSGSTTYIVTVNRNGATGTAFSANLSLTTSLPAGATASFSPSTVNFGATDTSTTSTLTISTTSATPAGSTGFAVQASNPAVPGDSSTGNGTLKVAQRTLTVTGIIASNKEYDATTGATLNTSSAALVGVASGDTVTLNTASATGTFSTKDVGTAKTVTISGLTISSASAGNYMLTQPTTTADITAATVTVTGITADSRVYDALTDATIHTGTAVLHGVLGTDAVSLVSSGATGAFVDKNVGAGKVVNISGLTLSGGDAGNYKFNTPQATATADITAATVTVTGIAADSRVYDALTDATIHTGTAVLHGVLGTDAVSLVSSGATGAFVDKNVGAGKVVNISGLTLSGGDAGNYKFNTPQATATADITAATVTVTGITADSRVYDALTDATIHTGTAVLHGVLGTDAVSLVSSGATGAFVDKNVGAGKVVNISGLTLSGGDAGNYKFNTPQATATADITAATVTVTGITADSRVYDALTDATIHTGTAVLHGVLGTDAVSLVSSGATGAFVDKNVGAGKVVNISGLTLSGGDAGNYKFNTPQATATADITAATVTVTGITADSRVYDALTDATIHTGTAVLHGVLGTDAVSLVSSGATGAFVDKNVGAGKVVNISGLTLSGGDAGNYKFNTPQATATADITAATVTVTGITADSRVYDALTDATIHTGTAVLHGVLGTDAVNLVSSGATGAFVDKNVGAGKVVNISGLTLSGGDAGNYKFNTPQATATADITAATVTVTGITADSRVYDALTDATIHTGTAVLHGVLGTDAVSLVSSGATGAFVDKNVGAGKVVNISGLTLSGGDAGNYKFNTPQATATADITAATVTVTGITADSRVYDALTDATIHTGTAVLHGVLGTDAVSLVSSGATGAFVDKNVGAGKVVNISGLTLSGGDAGNYKFNTPQATATADITAATVTVTGITADSRVYDALTDATIHTGTAVLHGVLGTDAVSLVSSGATGAFVDKNVGAGKVVNISGLTLSGGDAGNYKFNTPQATATADITAATVTVTGITADSRVYDALTDATIHTGTAVLHGVLGTDAVSLVSSGATGAFVDKNVGAGKVVNISGLTLSGGDAGNYKFNTPQATATADITAATVTVTGITADSRVYDALTDATIHTGTAVLHGVLGTDAVSLVSSGATGAFVDKNVGAGKVVNISGLTLSGGDAGNYKFNTPQATATADITAKNLTIIGAVANNREYDGGTSATVNFTAASLMGVIGTDAVSINSTGYSASFNDKNAGNGKPVTVLGVTLTGGDAGNYTVSQPTGLTANITAKNLTIIGAVANNREYDGGTSATVNFTAASLMGVIGTDAVSINSAGYSASFNDKNAGNGKPVTVLGVTLTGGDAGNYTVSQPTGLTANITAKNLTIIGAVANNREYDGGTSATVNFTAASLMGVIGTDAVSINSAGYSASFNDKNAGNGKPVTVLGVTLTGGDAGNYTVSQPTGLTANITAKNLTIIGAVANNREYDGGTSATVNFTAASLMGVIGTDAVSINSAGYSASFNDKNAGNGKPVTVLGVTLTGGDAGNYTVSQPTGLTANITAKNLTIIGAVANNREYDGGTSATVNFTAASLMGVIGTDAVSINSAGYSASFNDKNAGNGKPVTVLGVTLTGGDAGNYTVSQPTGLTANITAKNLTIIGAVANNREYDGGTSATVNFTAASLMGVIGTDAVSINSAGYSASFNDKNAGNGKPVTVLGVTLTGGDAGNYTVSQPTGLTANISPRPITVTADAVTKVYGSSDPPLTYKVTNGSLVAGDSFTGALTRVAGESVGADAILQGSLTVGTNYALTYVGANLTITQATTSTTVGASPNPSLSGQSVTFTATVVDSSPGSTGTPTGSVTFKDGATTIGTGTLNGSGQAILQISSLAVGPHSVTATYGGDANFIGSNTSSILTQQVNYGFLGFGAPYAAPPTTFNVTRTMPLKWQYTNSSGAVVNSATANPVVIINGPYTCGGSDTAGTITVNDAGASGYQYDPGSNSWQFNWQIKGNVVGCYDIYVKSQQSGQTTGPFPISVVNK